MKPNKSQSPRNRLGAAAVEFAVVLPVLVLLLLGGVEVGRAVMVQHALQEAAQAGCRLYTLKNKTQDDVQSIIATAMANDNITGYTVSFDPPSKSDIETHMEPVTVTVSVGYSDIAWSKPWFMSGATLVGRCTMPADLEQIPNTLIEDPDDPPPPDDDDDWWDDDDDWWDDDDDH